MRILHNFMLLAFGIGNMLSVDRRINQAGTLNNLKY